MRAVRHIARGFHFGFCCAFDVDFDHCWVVVSVVILLLLLLMMLSGPAVTAGKVRSEDKAK